MGRGAPARATGKIKAKEVAMVEKCARNEQEMKAVLEQVASDALNVTMYAIALQHELETRHIAYDSYKRLPRKIDEQFDTIAHYLDRLSRLSVNF